MFAPAFIEARHWWPRRSSRMPRRIFPGFVSALASVAFLLLIVSRSGSAQETTNGGATSRVKLSELNPPVYPPLARQAMIRGDVTVNVSLR